MVCQRVSTVGMDPQSFNENAHRLGISPQKSTAVYNEWAKNGVYDQSLVGHYRGPEMSAAAVADFFPENRHTNLVLDFASGTGLVGVELQKVGFRRIHGLDPSQGMLDEAEKKQVYEKQYCCYIDHNRLPIDDGTYDCAVSSGGMGEGHIPADGLREVARVVKPGGLVCIVMREEYLQGVAEYRDRLEDLMKEMEVDGTWKLHSRTIVQGYDDFCDYGANTGVVFMFVVS